jgi:chromosome segregation ATPase
MKPKSITIKSGLFAAVVIIFSLSLVAWDHQQPVATYFTGGQFADSPPKNKEPRKRKIRDLDEALEELDLGKLKLDEELGEINWDKLNAELHESLAKIDGDKIRMEIDKAMKEINFTKIRSEIEESMKEIDGAKIKMEIDKAMKEVDFDKIHKEIKESMKEIDMDKIKVELDKVKQMDFSKLDADMKKLDRELRNIGPEIEKSMENAKESIQKAKEELKQYKEFTNSLEKDGLIDKQKGYSIKHKNGELYINNKKQGDDVYNKYHFFLEKHKTFSFEKNDDDFNIDLD